MGDATLLDLTPLFQQPNADFARVFMRTHQGLGSAMPHLAGHTPDGFS